MDTEEDKRAYQKFLSRGVSKGEIARTVGVTKQAITRWKAVPVKYVTRLAQAYGVSRKSLRPSDCS